MKYKIYLNLVIFFISGVINTYAVQFTFLTNANDLLGFNGQALSANDQVEMGTYVNGVFTSLGSGSNDNIGAGPGFFSHTLPKRESDSLLGLQLAFRWSEAVSGQSAIAYVDINTAGLDLGIKGNWTVKGGDGSGADTDSNTIDLADLTTGGPNFNTLRVGATFVNAKMSTTQNVYGFPSFEIIPEPSTYALIGGLTVLGYVCIRRRK